MRTSARHEIGYVVKGSVKIETEHQTVIARAGDMLIMCPAEVHSTTALEDSQIFFVLLDPSLAPR
jgi:quercetin dioxygenase-like cupin family protein